MLLIAIVIRRIYNIIINKMRARDARKRVLNTSFFFTLMFFNGLDVWRTWTSNVRQFHCEFNNNIRNSFLITSTDLHNINNIMNPRCARLSANLLIRVCRFCSRFTL